MSSFALHYRLLLATKFDFGQRIKVNNLHFKDSTKKPQMTKIDPVNEIRILSTFLLTGARAGRGAAK